MHFICLIAGSLLGMFAELAYRESKNNMILCALWHEKLKPEMQMFLKPFAEELYQLSTEGIECFRYKDDIGIKSRVHAIVGPLDTIARCIVMNFKQFNGEFGCPYFLQKGEWVDYLNARIYHNENIQMRSTRSYERHLKKL